MGTDPSPDPWEVARRWPVEQRVEIQSPDGIVWTGRVMPPHHLTGDRILLLKLESGYNVGLRIEPETRFRLLPAEPRSGGTEAASRGSAPPPAGPAVSLLTTGGTIASRVDYATGGVRPVRTAAEILDFYPKLERDGPVRIVPVLDRLSENITPDDWVRIAHEVVRAFGDGARGVVVAHGTDTMGYTAAALGFLLVDLPGPVVLVGAQRSPDRPSSDGPENLAAAVGVARSAPMGEVVVLMHADLSDHRFAIHRGTRVRKMHSTRRDAFHSRNIPPLGYWIEGTLDLPGPVRPPHPGPPHVDGGLDPGAGGLLWLYPGLPPERAAAACEGLRGVILAGTGLGHVSGAHLPWIQAALARGVVVGMTTQCLEGRVDPYVYATGRDLVSAGVLYLEDLLPEAAYAKLLWALGQSRDPAEVRRLLATDRCGELDGRRRPEGAR
ncbi:MAG: Glu-tRNA(Gln) amidotransferase subunit GatD [Thermoplasmata archaeon]